MRIALLSLIAAPVLALAAAPALAADLGVYRPGTPYHSTPVPAADVCASACAGDAQCQGWNYVKPNPRATGVCELQSQIGAPVSSPISISGVNESAAPAHRRIVSGNTNTVRVGTATASTPTASARQMTRAAPSGRRIVRQPVSQRRAPQPTSAPSRAQGHPQPHMQNRRAMDPRMAAPQGPQARPAMRAPQARSPHFQPMLDGTPHPARPRSAPMTAPQQTRAQSPLQTRGPARSRGQRAAQPSPQRAAQAPMAQGRPPVGQPIAPQPGQAMSRPPQRPAAPMPTRSAAQPVTFEQAQNSLYGNLNDDVRIPAANTPMPTDPDAPIPTSQSRPVAPVQQQALAGAMPR